MLDHSSPLLGCSSFLNCLKLLAFLLQPKLMQNHGCCSKVDQWVLQLLRCRRISSSRQKYILARKKDFTSQEVYSCKEKKLQLSRSVEARIDIGSHCFWTSNAAIKADFIMQLHAGYVIASSWNGLELLKCCYSTCCCCSVSWFFHKFDCQVEIQQQ